MSAEDLLGSSQDAVAAGQLMATQIGTSFVLFFVFVAARDDNATVLGVVPDHSLHFSHVSQVGHPYDISGIQRACFILWSFSVSRSTQPAHSLSLLVHSRPQLRRLSNTS
jgi:hypothetical protein